MACFKELKPSKIERIDYALLAVLADTPCGFVTVMEMDANTAYLQYGGAFENARVSIHVFNGYKKMILALQNTYKNISTYIENTNTPMLKLAMRVGFRITGVKYFNGKILVEHTLEKKEF